VFQGPAGVAKHCPGLPLGADANSSQLTAVHEKRDVVTTSPFNPTGKITKPAKSLVGWQAGFGQKLERKQTGTETRKETTGGNRPAPRGERGTGKTPFLTTLTS